MDSLTYETVARFGLVSSLLVFMAIFIGVVIYVFFFTDRKKIDRAQRRALDLGPDKKSKGDGNERS